MRVHHHDRAGSALSHAAADRTEGERAEAVPAAPAHDHERRCVGRIVEFVDNLPLDHSRMDADSGLVLFAESRDLIA